MSLISFYNAYQFNKITSDIGKNANKRLEESACSMEKNSGIEKINDQYYLVRPYYKLRRKSKD